MAFEEQILDQDTLQRYYNDLVVVRGELLALGQGFSIQVRKGFWGEGIARLRLDAIAVVGRVLWGMSENIHADLEMLAAYTSVSFGPDAAVTQKTLWLCSLPELQREQLNQYLWYSAEASEQGDQTVLTPNPSMRG